MIKANKKMPAPKVNDDIDILILTYNDWCNTAYRYMKSLEKVGYKVKIFKGKLHNFGYPVQAPVRESITNGCIVSKTFPNIIRIKDDFELIEMIKRAKVINFHASHYFEVAGVNWKDKKIVVTHGGTAYRSAVANCNKIFNEIANNTVIQCPDLLNKGAKNEHLIYYAVDTDYIKPKYDFMDPEYIVIGHFPSNPSTKGTQTINGVIDSLNGKSLKNKFKYIGVRYSEENKQKLKEHYTPWLNQLERMSKCDIYIETCRACLHGLPFGEWGNTCLEASSLGKIVITNTHAKELYEKEYTKDYPLIIANNAEELSKCLVNVLNMNRSELMELKHKFRNWAEKYHNFQATGQRLKDKVYSALIK